MKTIEDCLEHLESLITVYPWGKTPTNHPSNYVSTWDKQFVSDVSTYTIGGSALSTAQAEITVKILNKYVKLFKANEPVVRGILTAPKYRIEPYQTVEVPKEVRWAGGPVFLFRTSYNKLIQSQIRQLTGELETIAPVSLRGIRSWRVVVDSHNIKAVMAFIQRHNYKFDDTVLEQFMHMQNNMSNPNRVVLTDDSIQLEINNDVLAALWVEDMENFRDV